MIALLTDAIVRTSRDKNWLESEERHKYRENAQDVADSEAPSWAFCHDTGAVYQVKMDEFEQAEAVVIDVIDGKRSFEEGLHEVVTYQEKWNESLCRYWRSQQFSSTDAFEASVVPAVPVEAFRELRLVSAERSVEQIFRTSGTTSGKRGEHARFGTRAYDHGARRHFDELVVGGARGMGGVHWVTSPASTPDSSLSHMVDDLSEFVGADPLVYLLDESGLSGVPAGARREAENGRPFLCFGTAYALAESVAGGEAWELPAGSVVVETGGFKSHRVGLSLVEYRKGLREVFGEGATYWSEYSMTELSSQGYGLLAAEEEPQTFEFPSWCRVTAVDPESLAPVDEGERGILRFVDLANVETCVAVQTEDVGKVEDNRVTLVGRSQGARPRGCSLAAEELLSVNEGVSRETSG
jgi:hypothetical protein